MPGASQPTVRQETRSDARTLPAGLLLAAGEGRRFGGPKALVEFAGELLVERGARLLVAGGCDPVVVVLGASARRVRAEADLADAEIALNHDWRSGMGSSLATGLRRLHGRAPSVVIALADQPLVGQEAVRRLITTWQSGAMIAVATYDGKARNPVLLDQAVWEAALQGAVGDRGARDFLHAQARLVTEVECGDTGSPADIDTPDDLEALREGVD